MSEVTVVGQVVAKAGKEAELAQLLQSVVEPTRNEEGSLHYSIQQSIETPGEFIAIERWRHTEDLQRHFRSAHSQHLAAAVEDLLAEPIKITIYRELT
ncbi:putative quinol monooxygenase [Kitasatospora sp. NPDC058397]|uniref:putative quinol monooxygenase n=1 Tax=unclassified Kitasatospora TaxID=2633591 RepID=UPI00365DE1B1